jgi:hypothetical protein
VVGHGTRIFVDASNVGDAVIHRDANAARISHAQFAFGTFDGDDAFLDVQGDAFRKNHGFESDARHNCFLPF